MSPAERMVWAAAFAAALARDPVDHPDVGVAVVRATIAVESLRVAVASSAEVARNEPVPRDSMAMLQTFAGETH
jgi:hypothetical protein